jgi:hypothetical protein
MPATWCATECVQLPQRLSGKATQTVVILPLPPCRELSDFIWSLSVPGRTKLPYHRFRRGDTVLLAPWKPGSKWARKASSSGGTPSGDSESEGEEASTGAAQSALEATVQAVEAAEVRLAVSKAVAETLGAAAAGGPGGQAPR